MKFCEKCGSYMRAMKGGFLCSRCGYRIETEAVEIISLEQQEHLPIDVVGEAEQQRMKVTETCPQCGNPEAFRSISFVSGEHAGVRQERSMERFTCTKCSHSWTKY